jgi:hypothetical protein
VLRVPPPANGANGAAGQAGNFPGFNQFQAFGQPPVFRAPQPAPGQPGFGLWGGLPPWLQQPGAPAG